ncbi:helix-turn-helix transcriptional regulator [Planctomycetota bacterium]
MFSDNDIKAICSISELAKRLGLSRARFYQLQKIGVFPMPLYCIRTKRPFYPLDLQQQCIRIRKTGIGHNGQLVIFYNRQKDKSQNQPDSGCKQLRDTLKQMGLNVTLNTVENAIKTLYPRGLSSDTNKNIIARDLFRYLRPGV